MAAPRRENDARRTIKIHQDTMAALGRASGPWKSDNKEGSFISRVTDGLRTGPMLGGWVGHSQPRLRGKGDTLGLHEETGYKPKPSKEQASAAELAEKYRKTIS